MSICARPYANLHRISAPFSGREMVYSGNRYCIILGSHLEHERIVRTARTNAPLLQGRPSTSPHTTSRCTPPAVCAIFRRFLLLSSPMVHMPPGRSKGRGRYFPFPVPESRPTHPTGKDDKNCAMIGQGCIDAIHTIVLGSAEWTNLLCNEWKRNVGRFHRKQREHV